MIDYNDYNGSQGQYAVIDGAVVAYSTMVIDALAQNAMVLALGDPAYVAKLADQAPLPVSVPA